MHRMRRWQLALSVTVSIALPCLICYWLFASSPNRTGGFTARLERVNGQLTRFVVFRPHVPPPESGYPMLLFLNGAGERGNDGVRQLSRNLGEEVWELKREFPFVVVAVQCSQSGVWRAGSTDTTRALAVLQRVIQECGVDENRVYLTGPSSGGAGTWALAESYPDLFAAVVPVCATSGSAESLVVSLEESGIPAWCLYNKGDWDGLVSANRELREALLKAGLSPMFSEFSRSGHNAWDPTYENAAVYDWLLRQDKSRNRRRLKMRYLPVLEAGLVNWDGDEPTAWRFDDGVLRHESVSAAPQPSDGSRLLIGNGLEDFELHFDYEAIGDSECLVVMRSESPTTENSDEVWIAITPPENGDGGVFHPSTGQWLCGLDPIGHQSFRAGVWNDVRVHRTRGRLEVFLNGWRVVDLTLPLQGQVRLGLAPSDNREGESKWRFVRLLSLPARERESSDDYDPSISIPSSS